MEHNENVVICPPCGENVGLPTKRGANKENLFLPLLPRLTAVLPPQGREMFRGFTLIELLVVVLIIGILAAVAVPQYQKVVEMVKITKTRPFLSLATQAIDMYLLEHGFPTPSDFCGGCNSVDFMGPNHGGMQVLTVDLQEGLDCRAAASSNCADDTFLYDAACYETYCRIRVKRHLNEGIYSSGFIYTPYWIDVQKVKGSDRWTYSCSVRGDAKGKTREIDYKICASFNERWRKL